MPVASIAGEPRGVEAQHRPDLAGAQPCYEPLKAWSRHHPTGGAAEIVIDYPRCRGNRGAGRPRLVRTVAAGFRDCSEPAPGLIAEHRPPPYAAALRLARDQRSSSSCSRTAPPPASNNRPASRSSTALRSQRLMPRSLTESRAMLSWPGDAADWADAGRFLILLPQDETVLIPGASSETAFDQQMMKLKQRRYCHTRRANRLHTRA